MVAKFSTTASDNVVAAVIFRKFSVAEPADKLVTHALYEATVAPLAIVNTSVSLAEMVELVSVKPTLVCAANEAPFIVIWPEGLFSVTPVDLLVSCVTLPCPPVA